MADNVNINLNISGDFKAKIREYTKLITHANNVVKGLKTSLESLAGAGDKGFDSKHITDSLASVQRAFAGFQKINGEDLRKAVEALDPTKLRAFGGALTQFQTELTAELITRITSFSTSLKGLGEAQKALDSGTLVQQLNALSHAMPALKQAISSDNFRTFSENIKSLHVNTQDIAGIIRLGAALKNINKFSSNANSLSELARGITNLTRIKETSGFLRNVQNIADAGTKLHDMKPIDFTKITKGISALTRVTLSDEQWKDIAKTSSEIKKAFADLRSVKLPNLVGFKEGIDLLNQSGAKLKDHTGLTQNVGEIKASLEQLSSVKMPNLGNLVKNLNKLSDETYDFKKINEHVRQFKKTLGQLHGVHVPSLAGFAKGLTELKNINAGEFQNLNTAISGIPAALEGWNKVKVPNLASFTKGLKELGSGAIDFKQVSDNLKNLPNRLKKLSEIQAPDLAKFSKGIIDLSNTSINATRAANAIDEALTVLSKHSNMQIKLPSLANFAKGLNELTKFTHTKDSLQTQINNINAFVNSFSGLSGIKLPNVQGMANAIHKLSTAVPENAGTTAAAHIESIKTSLAGFDKIKLPNLKNLADGFNTIANIVPQGLKETGFRQNLLQLKTALTDTFKDLGKFQVPNLKNVAQAFKILNEPTKYNADGVANVTKNAAKLKQAVEMLEGLDTKFPNLKNLADGFKSLDNVFKSKDVVDTGKFGERIKQIKDAATDLTELGKLKLPNLNSLAQGFKVLDSIPKNANNEPAINNFKANIGKIKEATEELVGLSKIKLPNLKNIADGFRSLDVAIPKGQDATNIGKFKDNVDAIKAAVEGLDKVKLPNLKNLADGFKTLNDITIKYKFDSNAKYVSQIKEIANEIKTAFAGFNNIQLPNVKNLADGFKALNSIGEGSTTKETYQKLSSNMRLLKSALEQIKDFGNVSFPNIKNIAQGMKDLRSVGDIGQDISTKFDTVRQALEKIQGIRVPNLQNFSQGFSELKKIIEDSSKASGNLNTKNFANEITQLATALGSFGKVSVPNNLSGFAKGIEAITKVNIEGFSAKFQRLIQEIDKFKIDPNKTMIDAFNAKLMMAANCIAQIDSRMQQSQQQFGSFGRAVEQTITPLDKFSARVKMFLQYRVISAVFNNFTNWLQSVPEQIREFEKAMYNVQSITGATNSTIAQLGLTVKDIASTTKFSAAEVADGMTMIAQAGFSAGQSMQMMQSISNLATGTLTDMKTTVDLVTSAMVVFNIEAHNASRVSDVFANAVNKSKLTMDKIKTAFNYIGPVARDAGVSFEETAVSMMLLANSGQKASTIGTGLRNVFSTLLSPSKKLTEAANAAGVALVDLDPRVNSMKTVIENLAVVVRDSSVALDVFGKRGSTAVLSLTNGLKDYDRLISSVQRVGSAADMASKQQEGLYVRWKNMHDRAQLVAVTLGENGLTGALGMLIDKFSAFLNSINQANESMGGRMLIKATMLSTAFATFGATLAGVIKYFPMLWSGIKAGNVALATMTARIMGVKVAADAAGASMKALTALSVNVGIIAVFTALAAAIAYASEKAKDLENKIKDTAVEIGRIKGQIAAYEDALMDFNKYQQGTEEYANAIRKVMAAFEENKGAVKEASREYDNLLLQIDAVNGRFRDGGAALRAYGEKLKELELKKATDQLKNLTEQFQKLNGLQAGSKVRFTQKGKEMAMEKSGKTTETDVDFWGEGKTYEVDKFNMSYAKSIELLEQIRSKAVDIKDIFQGNIFETPEQQFSEWRDWLNQLTEQSINLLYTYQQAGQISFDMPIEYIKKFYTQLSESNEELGITKEMLDVILYQFNKIQGSEFNGMFSRVIGSDLLDNLRAITGETRKFNEELKTVEFIKIDDKKTVFENITRSVEEAAKKLTELSQGTVVFSADDISSVSKTIAAYRELYQEIEDRKQQHLEKVKEISEDETLLDEEKVARIKDLNKQRLADEEELVKQSDALLKKLNESENTSMLARAAGYHSTIDIKKKAAKEEYDIAVANFEKIAGVSAEKLKELTEEERKNLEERIYLKKELSKKLSDEERKSLEDRAAANKAAYDAFLRAEESYQKQMTSYRAEEARRMQDALRSPEGAESLVKERLKAFNLIEKRADAVLQHELNNIRVLEEAHSISFDEARQREQNAIVRKQRELSTYLEHSLDEIKKKYPTTWRAVATQIQDKLNEVVAKSEEEQFKLMDKNIKKGLALRSAAAKQIESLSKEAQKAVVHAQESALHEIAVLEAQGVITHEQAEQSKAEASIKYMQSIIRINAEQMAALSKTPEMAAENMQQIQQLAKDIQKYEEDILKARRKGIEEQTKIITEGKKKLADIEGKMGADAFSAKEQAKITANYEKEFNRRRHLGEENARALAEAETQPLDKVTQAVQKHAAKRLEIQSKTADKVANLEKELAQKQEDFERKKLDIINKYNAKRRDLQTSLQDKLHNIETAGLSGKEKERADIDYARGKRDKAMRDMDEAISSGDSQALDRISKELESAMGAFEGASKPKQYKGEIIGIYEALQKVIDAQEEIEKKEAERKNTQEVDAIQKKIETANDAMAKSLAVENERHTKTMGNMEKEANKIREQIALAEKLKDTYINSIAADAKAPVIPQIPQQGGAKTPNYHVDPSSVNGQIAAVANGADQALAKIAALGDAAKRASEAGAEAASRKMREFLTDAENGTELWYNSAADGAVRLSEEQAKAFRENADEWIKNNGKVYQSQKEALEGNTDGLVGNAIDAWNKAYDAATVAAREAADNASTSMLESLTKGTGSAGEVLAKSLGQGAAQGGQAVQNVMSALQQTTQGIAQSMGISLASGVTTGVEQAKAVEQQWRWEERDGKMWAVYGQGLADAMADGVGQAQNVEKAWRTEVLADGRILYTNLTEAQRQGYADMAAAAKTAASSISTEYETLYTRITKNGKDSYKELSQEQMKAVAEQGEAALKAGDLFVKTTERGLSVYQNMTEKISITDWAKKFNAAEAEKAAYDTAKKAMGTWTSVVQESEPAYVSVEVAEATLNKAETEVEAAKLKIAEKALELGVKVHDGSVSEVKAKAEQLIAMIETNSAEILVNLDEKGKQQAVSEVQDLVKELETKETVMLEAEADKKKLDEVNDTVKKLTDDISKKQQILLKPGLDETEKRKILGDIEKLTNDAKAKLSELQVQIKDEEAKKQVAQIIAMLDKIPKETHTKIGVQINEAIRDIDEVIRKLNSIPKSITTVHKIKEEKAAGGLVGAYATGGRVRRPEEPEQYADGGQTFRRLPSRYINRGSGHKDDVPALLMKNEFVHRAAAVKKYGLNFMYKLNNLEIPASITRMFADGGLVSNAVTSIQKFATGGLVKSARRKLEDMFSGSGVNLNVDNLNVVGKIEQAADSITSPIGVQALHTIAKSIEANVARFAEGGPLTSTVLTSRQMSEISGKYHTIIAQARQEGNTAIAKALSEEQANLAKLASALKGNLDNINITYNKQVQKLTEAHNKRVSEKEAEYKSNVNSENESYGKRVESDNKAHAKEDEEYNKSIAQLKSDYEKELEELEKALKDKKEAARKEEEREAKEEAKTQKSYEKEDKRYAKETADRKKSHDDELAAAKKEYEDAQFKYEAELEQKKQEVDAKKSEIENFKNQMASRKFPANSKKIREASVEEVMEAHIAQTKSENKGDDYIYAIDLGGLVKAEDNKGEPPTDAEIQKLYKAIRPYTETEKRHRDKLATIAYNPPYSKQAQEQLEKYNNDLNELTGYNAYKRALKAKELGVSIANIENADKEPSKPRQSKPYRDYLNSHYTTDYKQPYAQAQRDLDEFLKADSPKTTYDKRVAELKQAYNEAKKEAEEARAEVMEQRKEHAEQLAETRANRAEELRQAQIDYNEGVAAAKEKYNTDLSEAEENRRVSLEERKTAIAERDKEHKDNLESYKKDYDDTVSEATASYNEDMASAKESYDSDVSSARSQYSDDVASLRETTQNNVNSAKESMNSSISRAQADMQEEFKSQEDAARTALAEKKDTYGTTMKEAEEDLVSSVIHPSTTVAAQESVEKATEQISENAVLQKYGMGVEELIRRLSKGLWKFATGGLVPSTATSKPNTDSVLSLLMPNEFVMSAKAVRTFGLDFMHSINNLRLPAFAAGGFAGAGGSASPEIRSFKAGEMAVNKTIHALDLTINNTHIGELMGERNVIDKFIGEMQRAKMGLGAMA